MFASLVSPGEGLVSPMGGCYPIGDGPMLYNCRNGIVPQTGWCGLGVVKFP